MAPAKAAQRLFQGIVVSLAGLVQSAAYGDHGEKLDEFLSQGKLAAAQQHFRLVVAGNAEDQVARASQGLTEFLMAIEQLGQANYRHGLMSQHARNLPMARLPIPTNPEPQRLSYSQLREVVADFNKRLASAENTLAQVNTQAVKIPLYLGRVRLDLDGNGVLAEEETLWRIFAEINRGVEAQQGENFHVSVDGADLHWLRGYCHFLMAACEATLAYDEQKLFERCGQLLFPKIDSPFVTAKDSPPAERTGFNETLVLDAIAAIHLVQFPLVDRDRLAAAHRHLASMIEQSRLSWERANAEIDDDHEWIPNPSQTGVARVRVSREIVTAWTKVLDELEAIVQGKKLIPYWRLYGRNLMRRNEIPASGTGINFKRLFLEPRDFDLVLTIQGSHVEPFLVEGELSTPEAWNQLTQVFRGQFFGFAIWFN